MVYIGWAIWFVSNLWSVKRLIYQNELDLDHQKDVPDFGVF